MRKGQGGRSGSNRHLRGSRPRMLAVTPRPPREKWKAGSAPRNRRQRRYRPMAPEPAVTHRRPCQRVSAPPPPHRSALEACRGQLHVRARALPSPCSVTSRPARRRAVPVDGAGGIRTHGLELMRLARTASPLPRAALERARVWSAGFEPAISDARSRWGGHLPYDQSYCDTSPAGLEPATRGVEALCSSAELRGDRRHSVSDFSRTPASVAHRRPWNRTTLDRLIRAAPAQPARRRCLFASTIPPSGIVPLGSPPSAGHIPEGVGFAAATATGPLGIPVPELAGRIRTSVLHPRKVALASAELRRVERSRRESNPPHPGDSRAAQPGRVREQ